MTIVFAADLHQPDDSDDIPITHDDPVVMTIARAILDAESESNGWEWQMRGATQDSAYYAEPYRRTIAHTIEVAVAVRDALEAMKA